MPLAATAQWQGDSKAVPKGIPDRGGHVRTPNREAQGGRSSKIVHMGDNAQMLCSRMPWARLPAPMSAPARENAPYWAEAKIFAEPN